MNMFSVLYFAADKNQHVIQVGLTQSLIGIGLIILSIGVAWGTLKTSVKNIGTDLKEVKKDVKDLRDSIGSHSTEIVALKVHTKYGMSNSPLTPNEKGKKLLEDSKFNQQYPKLKSKIFKLMDKRSPRTLYDYESTALLALKELKDDPLIDPIKDFAVNNPQVPLDDVLLVGSWIVRDDYAKRIKRDEQEAI
jgi:hypothetical protein